MIKGLKDRGRAYVSPYLYVGPLRSQQFEDPDIIMEDIWKLTTAEKARVWQYQ